MVLRDVPPCPKGNIHCERTQKLVLIVDSHIRKVAELMAEKDKLGETAQLYSIANSMLEKEIRELREKNRTSAQTHEESELLWQIERHQLSEELASLRRKVPYDGLTSLFNSTYFREAMEQEFSRAARYGEEFSLIFLDLDYFKEYNDRNGHLAGDRALFEVAAFIKRTVRETDIPCRYGGEEFAVILPQTGIEGACEIAERLRTGLASQDLSGGADLRISRLTGSFGVATYGDAARQIMFDSTCVMAYADRMLYKAKRNGKNKVCCFDPRKETDVSPAQPDLFE